MKRDGPREHGGSQGDPFDRDECELVLTASSLELPPDAPTFPQFESIADDELLASVHKFVARSNTHLAELLANLAEVEARGIQRNNDVCGAT